jgi:uncharacterized membrane protein
MTGLIILLILIPIAAFVLLITILSRTSEQQKITESLYDRIKHLSDEIAALTKEIKNLKQPAEAKNITAEEKPVQKVSMPLPIITTVPKEEKKEEAKPVFTTEIKQEFVIEIKREEVIVEKKGSPGIIVPTPKQGTDIEKFIGENLANKIGIAVLVLGISFFVKYAIDQNWIKETGRVIIGLIAGGILIGIAHHIRNSYRSFSSVLMGGGLTVFYFTIAFAFHQYHLISQTAGFIIMVIITAFAVVLSLYYDRLELAILATIGGFITPFLVSTGQENYTALFTYLCILNSGLMVLAWFKRWPSINIIALFFTTIIYGSWLIKKMWFDYPVVLPYKDALLFGTLFYLQFVAMNIINNIRQKKIFNAFDFLIVLSINFLFYLAGMFILSYWSDGAYKGLFTALLGIFNLALVIGFKQKKTIDPNFLSLLTGLAITFISLTAPVQLKGNHVTLFWAAETVILFWLFQKTRAIQLKIASLVIAVLMLVSLAITWLQVYSGHQLMPIFINMGFSTTIAVAVSLFVYYKLMYKEADTFYLNSITNRAITDFLLGAFIVTLYLSGALEIFYQFSTRSNIETLYIIYLQLYTFIFSILVLFSFRKSTVFPVFKFLFTILCLGLYIININANHEVSLALLEKNNGTLFISHWISVVLLIWLLLDLVIYFKKTENKNWASYLPAFTWLSAIGIVLLLSVEMYQLNLWINYEKGLEWAWWENLYYKAGLSIVWSLCSFIMMWLGMHYKFRPLRIISLSLFTLTLIKLFIYDIRNIPPGGKIAAFILLGVLLLTVSFMYQRLKKIIIDDIENNNLSA